MRRRPHRRFASAWRRHALAAVFAGMISPSVSLAEGCIGDCDANGATTLEDVVLGVGAALASAEGVCAGLTSEGESVLTVDGLVRGVLDLRRACGLEPDLELFPGVYDADVVYDAPSGSAFQALATIWTGSSGGLFVSIDAGLYDNLSFTALPTGDGTLSLQGTRIEGGDIAFSVVGTATLSAEGTVLQLDADVVSGAFDSSRHIAARLRRPVSGTPPNLTGDYLLTLRHGSSEEPRSSSIVLPVDVPSGGVGTCGPATVHSTLGVLGSIEAERCQVSPEGRILFQSVYVSSRLSPARQFFALRGALAADDEVQGQYQIGNFPMASDVGFWEGGKLVPSPQAR